MPTPIILQPFDEDNLPTVDKLNQYFAHIISSVNSLAGEQLIQWGVGGGSSGVYAALTGANFSGPITAPSMQVGNPATHEVLSTAGIDKSEVDEDAKFRLGAKDTQAAQLEFARAGVLRWLLGYAENGNFQLAHYDSAGNAGNIPLDVDLTTGIASMLAKRLSFFFNDLNRWRFGCEAIAGNMYLERLDESGNFLDYPLAVDLGSGSVAINGVLTSDQVLSHSGGHKKLPGIPKPLLLQFGVGAVSGASGVATIAFSQPFPEWCCVVIPINNIDTVHVCCVPGSSISVSGCEIHCWNWHADVPSPNGVVVSYIALGY